MTMKHDANLNRCQEVQVFKTKKQPDSATGKAGTVRSQVSGFHASCPIAFSVKIEPSVEGFWALGNPGSGG